MEKNNKLVVMYTEDERNPENTWSGTSYALRVALEKYCDVEFVDLKRSLLFKGFDFILKKTNYQRKLSQIRTFLWELHANHLLRKYKNIPVLEIANEVKVKNKFYLYQDLAVAVLPKIQLELKDVLSESTGGILIDIPNWEMMKRIEEQYKIYEKTEKVFFMGTWVKDEMEKLYPELNGKFSAVGGGINKDFLSETIKCQREDIIVFTGIDFERKGGLFVLKAFDQYRKNYNQNAKLVIIGPETISVEEPGVVVLGKLSRSEIVAIYSKAKVFCMPSFFEAYGLVFPEAQVHGLITIGRNCYEMPYFIDSEIGYLIESDDADEVAKMFDLAIKNDQMLCAVEKRKKALFEQYSWDRVAKTIADVILGENT